MKKIILTFAFASLICVAFATRTVIKENGGLFGYKSVAYQSGGGNSTLLCSDPGLTRCRGGSAISVTGTDHMTDALITRAEVAIKNGRLNGVITEQGGHQVTWNATDEYNATIVAE